MSYIAANGQEITEQMIDRWCEAYERGEFPEGERTVGDVVHGQPPRSVDSVMLGVKMPRGMKAALAAKAKANGTTMSDYARAILAEDLMSA